MPPRKALFALSISALALAACAPQLERVGSAAPPPRVKPDWAFQASDVPLEPGYRFGKLANGMRYVVRSNSNPKGTALVRLQFDAGSLDEEAHERGYAHYVEHMAFNGSSNVPEGEMIKLLERDGLAFGADTNASTSYDQTTYKLDLPRADMALLDTALFLMRETASELSFSPQAVERERGVVLAELRDRNGFALRNFQDQIEFLAPGSRFAARLPIGTLESLNGATAESLKAFWRREYVPTQATLFVVGDFDGDKVERAIVERFGSWKPAPAEPAPQVGPLTPGAKGQEDLHLDPALSERVIAVRKGPWLDEPDNLNQRRENLLRLIGYGIVNRRLLRRTRENDAPFRNASLSTSDIFREGRATELAVDTVDRKWRRGLIVAAEEYRRVLLYGFTQQEIAEQLANIRNAHVTAADSAATRSHAQLLGAALALVNDDRVPDTPKNSLDRLEAFIPGITPDAVLAALRRELVPLDAPLLRFQGRTPPAGGTKGLRSAWDEAMRQPVARPQQRAASEFAYTRFGPAGTVVSDGREDVMGIRMVRFANGVRLNLKRTELEKDRVLVQLSVDGGNMLATKDNPLATRMVSVLSLGGLGKHSRDELDTLLAGRSVSANFSATDETFVASAGTTPRDLELELQLLAAQLTDPGWRKEGEVLFRQTINNMFASLRATPGAALNADLGAILADGDPRFALGEVEPYRKLTFAKLKTDIADRLDKGAIEIGMVGDLDEEEAIALVGRTFGALPAREAEFRPYAERRNRPFTAQRKRRVLHHTGAKDQALVTMIWPTRDGEDPVQTLEFALFERIVRIALTDTLREKLGQAYSPGAASSLSRSFTGYGTFSVAASVDVDKVPAASAAIAATIAALRDKPVSQDMLQRARAPLLESFDNALKTNGGWLAFVDRAQTEPDRIERQAKAHKRLQGITAERLQAVARQYLTANGAVEINVLPNGVQEGAPAPAAPPAPPAPDPSPTPPAG
jgi:zinc protease